MTYHSIISILTSFIPICVIGHPLSHPPTLCHIPPSYHVYPFFSSSTSSRPLYSLSYIMHFSDWVMHHSYIYQSTLLNEGCCIIFLLLPSCIPERFLKTAWESCDLSGNIRRKMPEHTKPLMEVNSICVLIHLSRGPGLCLVASFGCGRSDRTPELSLHLPNQL